ncbi:MAG TPA: cyanophycin synthetase [Thermoanaerobaculia bacterium]|nr:cyanophycin synthetase [Thermoanaerobaculia bacterium]
MKILETRVYRGPNLYALGPVIRLRVDLGELEAYPTLRLPGFNERLLELVPTLHEHSCSYGEPGGFVRRMREDEGTWLGHVLEHVAIELQCLAGTPVTYGKTRSEALPTGQYHVIYSFAEEAVGTAAGALGLAVIRHLLPPEREAYDPSPFDFRGKCEALVRLAQRRAFGPSTGALVRAAEERDIPWIRLNDRSLVQLGHGKFQRRIQATITSETRHTAVEIASDKRLTNQILADLGLPVPRQVRVYDADEAVDAVEAGEAAGGLGYPVVVKPLDGNHGKGVSIGLRTAEQVRTAFEEAAEYSSTVIVETFQEGNDYRLLVVNGRLLAVAQRLPGHVIGDGRHTLAELVEIVNQDPRRGVGHEKVLTRLELDDQALRLIADAGLTPESVPAEGEVFYLRSTGNLSTGGTSIDKTDAIHYDNRIMAERGVRALGLDVGGVDFIAPDISRSYKEAGGAIVEINAAPGFRMHTAPTEGTPRDVAGPVIDMLFPQGTPYRIPIAAITGTNGKTTTTRMVGHILKLSGHTVGMATSDGVYIDGVLTVKGDMTGPWASHLVLRDPTVDAAVLETARGGIVRTGLGWRKCSVGAVLNVASDHLGMGGIDSLDDLARVKQVIVEVARDHCVLNADDPRVVRMARHSPGRPIYVTMDPRNERVAAHVRHERGAAVSLEEGLTGRVIVLYQNGEQVPLLPARQVPATVEGVAIHNIQNAMFAAAIAHGLGIGVENIRQGLRTFTADFFQTPGRLNFYNEHPFRVLLDYAHNAHGMQAMTRLIRGLAVHGRRIGVIAAPGDRRDEDIAGLATAAAPAFDLVLIREDDNRRGRPPGEVGELLRHGLVAAGFPADCIAPEIYPEEQAVAKALAIARAGDLLVIFGDNLGRVWDQIVSFPGTRPEGAGEDATTAGAGVTENATTEGEAAAARDISFAGPPAAAAPAGRAAEVGSAGPAPAKVQAATAVPAALARSAAAPALAARDAVAGPAAQAAAANSPSAPVWPPADRERSQTSSAARSSAATDPRDAPSWPTPGVSAEILPDDFDD